MPRGPLLFILVTLFLDAVGIGLIYPVMPDLIADVQGGTIGSAAIWGGVLATAYAAMQFLGAPVLGAISDRFGRRPVLLVSLAVMALDYIASALAPSIWLLLVLRIVAGITAATHATCNAAMADITPPEKRSQTFGLLGAAFMGGFIFGPVLGGVLGEWGPRAPFWTAAAFAILNLALGWWTLPETVTDATRRPLTLARANPFGAMRAVGRLGGATRLLGVLFLTDLAFTSYVVIWAYWGKAAFGWSTTEIGVSLAAFGIVSVLAQAWGIRFYLRWLGERGTILFGFLFSLLFFLIFGLLPQSEVGGWIAILICPLSAMGEVSLPALQGLISRLAPADAQGETQGVVASVRSAAQIVGPLAMTGIFAYGASVGTWPLLGLPYLLGAALILAAFLVFVRAPAT